MRRAMASSEGGAEREALIARLEELRDAGFDSVLETASQLPSIIVRLEPLARHSFQGLSEIARNA